jgi:hypothetical protein
LFWVVVEKLAVVAGETTQLLLLLPVASPSPPCRLGDATTKLFLVSNLRRGARNAAAAMDFACCFPSL